jgi:hypothetical protein
VAQFIGYLKGARGPTSRLGHKNTGLLAEASGWHLGARVRMYHSDDGDKVRIFLTRGSGGGDIVTLFDGTLKDAIRKGKAIEKMHLANHNLRMARAVPTINRIGEEGP